MHNILTHNYFLWYAPKYFREPPYMYNKLILLNFPFENHIFHGVQWFFFFVGEFIERVRKKEITDAATRP